MYRLPNALAIFTTPRFYELPQPYDFYRQPDNDGPIPRAAHSAIDSTAISRTAINLRNARPNYQSGTCKLLRNAELMFFSETSFSLIDVRDARAYR
jgi:hypothetical protein